MSNADIEPSVVVVGGGVAGARTCQELRKLGFTGRVTLLSDEPSLPYDRPPLSKAVLRGKREPVPLRIDYADLDIDVHLQTPARSVDFDDRVVRTEAAEFGFGHLVIATGARPIRLPGAGEQLTLRTDADAVALRDRLQPGARVVLVGASWIGAEVATVALERECVVTCVEFGSAPSEQALGPDIAKYFTPWWSGVDLRLGRAVAEVATDAASPNTVVLDDGTQIPADVVVVGIGVRANVGWLDGTPLETTSFVAVDAQLRTSVPGVWALGDVASWWSRRYEAPVAVQHWDDAYTAPAIVAEGICRDEAGGRAHDPVPYFWSDQFGHRIEVVGRIGGEPTILPAADGDPLIAIWPRGGAAVAGVLVVDAPKEAAAARKLLAGGRVLRTQELSDTTFVELLERASSD